YPCFVKPANLGSSVGISKARSQRELVEAIHLALSYDRRVIVEEGIDAREVEIAILGNDRPMASVAGEIIPKREFYDYEANSPDGGAELRIPADLTPEERRTVEDYAIRAFQAIDAAGLARVDFFLERGTGRILVNEINTMPGFTRFSMYPKLWEASGLAYDKLLDRLIELALERHAERNQLLRSYDKA
ncbi:ATP-grasp domain-containing protein, partial [Alicyclobacillus sendaiensis]|uniref:ATP-grasp domain-containing protein n=1 Tax=Alicyclobacillus sendaiensis TaxID=192387 RepID=UPI0026F433E0